MLNAHGAAWMNSDQQRIRNVLTIFYVSFNVQYKQGMNELLAPFANHHSLSYQFEASFTAVKFTA